MQILRWRNKKEARTERLLRQLNLSNMTNKAVSYRDFTHTMQHVGQVLPDISKITSFSKRKHYQVNVYSIYQNVTKNSPKSKITFRYGSTPYKRRRFSELTHLKTMAIANPKFMSINKATVNHLQDRLSHIIKQGQEQRHHKIHNQQRNRNNHPIHNSRYSLHKQTNLRSYHKYRHYDGPSMD